jgi:hypothetical protein
MFCIQKREEARKQKAEEAARKASNAAKKKEEAAKKKAAAEAAKKGFHSMNEMHSAQAVFRVCVWAMSCYHLMCGLLQGRASHGSCRSSMLRTRFSAVPL